MDAEYYQIGPGVWGFIVMFGMAIAVILLGRSMTRHLRKVRLESAAREEARSQASGGVEDGKRGGDEVADEGSDGQ